MNPKRKKSNSSFAPSNDSNGSKDSTGSQFVSSIRGASKKLAKATAGVFCCKKSSTSVASSAQEPIDLAGETEDEEEAEAKRLQEDKEEFERLKKKWTQPIYGFFTPSLRYDDSRTPPWKYHFFKCNSPTCKGNPPHGVK
ncbi:hypothetical protein C8J56DRAFT_1057965 [Mycena floridula]|nr:hypothetical protein C8J56DRAFT_1057965 [Mycena floridula]